MLSVGLADGGAHDQFEYLILGKARLYCRFDIVRAYASCVVCDLIDKRAYRRPKPYIIEGGAPPI
jgi:hypothetical protein